MTEDGIASQLNSELSQAQLDTQRLGQQFSLYRLQASTLRNLLLVSSTTIDELSQGIARQQQAPQELGTAVTQGTSPYNLWKNDNFVHKSAKKSINNRLMS